MKAKFYIGFFSALLLTVITGKAQYADSRDFRNDGAAIVVNNYYDNYDYYYSSRINRFHRSYSAFTYYSPVFTDSYWYNYQPYSWGLSIYGRSGFGFGYAVNYPVYYGYYDYGGYDPYYGSSWYWGYDPFFYSWYSPVVINIYGGNRWANNYWGWNRHDHWYNNYGPSYHSHNNYYYNTYNNYSYSSSRYSSREFSGSTRNTQYSRTSSGSSQRREVSGATTAGNRGGVSGGRETASGTETRRSSNQGTVRGQVNQNNGNNRNSRVDGNNGNFDQNDNNTGNNGNNNNSRTEGNNGNFGDNNRNTGNSGNNQRSRIDGNNGNFSDNPGNKGNVAPATVPGAGRQMESYPGRTRTSTEERSVSRVPAQVNPGSTSPNTNNNSEFSGRSSQSGRTFSAPRNTSRSSGTDTRVSQGRTSSSKAESRSSRSSSKEKSRR